MTSKTARKANKGKNKDGEVAPYLEVHGDGGKLIGEEVMQEYRLADLEDAYEQLDEEERRKAERDLTRQMTQDEARKLAQDTAHTLRMRKEKGYEVQFIADPLEEVDAGRDLEGQVPCDPLQATEDTVQMVQLAERMMTLRDPLWWLRRWDSHVELPKWLQALEAECASWRLNKTTHTEAQWRARAIKHTHRYMTELHVTPLYVTHVFHASTPFFLYLILRRTDADKDRWQYAAHYYLWSESHMMDVVGKQKAIAAAAAKN
jgi:hypothetical protein